MLLFIKQLFSYLILFLFVASCNKQTCDANCSDIRISGKVINASTNAGLADIPIRVYWQDQGICYSCPEIDVGNSKTNQHGDFNFTVPADTGRFGRYGLNMEIPVPSGYIKDYTAPDDRIVHTFSKYNPTDFQNLSFILHSKANLSIKLQRTQNDNFNNFILHYKYGSVFRSIYSYTGQPPVAVTDFNIVTGANVYTKILWTKWNGGVQISSFIDSIICALTGINSIIVNY